jgi:hypothetical protein
MIIEIRVVIDVPEKDKEDFQEAIENILKFVREQFPRLKTTYTHSPVIVTIKDMDVKL